MALNGEKFELVRYGRNEDLKNSTNYKYNNQLITEKEHVKDLGVFMSDDATFSHHINKIIEAGRNLSGWVLRTFNSRDGQCLKTLWKCLVVPRLEYCCQLWSPYKIQEIANLEAIQRSFTVKIQGVQHLNYWDRLSQLKLYSLQRRRERYIIIYVWKILEGRVPNVGIVPNYHPRKGRLCYIMGTVGSIQRVKTIKHNSFTHNGPRFFNCLPRDLWDQKDTSPECFKRKLDKWLDGLPDHPPIPGYPYSHHNTLPEAVQNQGQLGTCVS
ncbi:uncharacterized protein LOC143037393 [Oratosquilla oratoria]|uniref:uncharacterized protein LOC143037393 n=1 Tax=Oratosquilla oratoria TaxID=337810 RepID=UPI003F76089C